MIPPGLITKVKKLFLIKARYATTSLLATSVDVGIFLGLANYGGLSRVTANTKAINPR